MYADFLYWQRSPGLPFVSNGLGFSLPSGGTPADIAVGTQGRSYELAYGYAPGFDIGFTIDLGHGGWDVGAKYLWIHNGATSSFTGGSANDWQQPLFFLVDITTPQQISSATVSGSSALNFLEFDVGSNIFLSKTLMLRPHFAVVGFYRPAFINASYDYTINVSPGVQYKHSRFSTTTSSFGTGGGVGFNTSWLVGDNWSFIANMKFFPVWSHHAGHGNQEITNISTGQKLQNLNSRFSVSRFELLSDFFLGLDWHMMVFDNKYGLSAYAGWEFFSGFFDAFIVSAAEVGSNSVNYQGLKLGFDVGF